MSNKKKPFGVIATAIYASFSGFLFIPIGFLLLLASQAPSGGGLFTMFGILFSVMGVMLLAAVYGLWSLQEWGRSLMFWLFALAIPLGIITIFPIWPDQQATVSNTMLQLFGIGIDLLIMLYLSRHQVRLLYSDAD